MPEFVPGAREIVPGLWRWVAYHPEWKEDVGCVALVSDKELVLVDPLLPDEAPTWQALERAVEGRALALVLTVFWHERSACEITSRYRNAALWAQLGGEEKLACEVTNPFRPGDKLPGGLEALGTGRGGEILLWEPRSGTLIPGDVLLGGGESGLRMCPEEWLPEGFGHEGLRRVLQPLLVLPIERVLVSHGEPVLDGARAALAQALQASDSD